MDEGRVERQRPPWLLKTAGYPGSLCGTDLEDLERRQTLVRQ